MSWERWWARTSGSGALHSPTRGLGTTEGVPPANHFLPDGGVLLFLSLSLCDDSPKSRLVHLAAVKRHGWLAARAGSSWIFFEAVVMQQAVPLLTVNP